MNREDEAKYVINSTVRFFRNVEDVPFVSHFASDDAEDINIHAKAALSELWGNKFDEININSTPKNDVLLWSDRNVCFVNTTPTEYRRMIFEESSEEVFVLTNDAEHIFVQAKENRFDIEHAMMKASQAVNSLSENIPFAVSDECGFLTANPYVSGTGMKACFLLHLPALTLTPQMGKIADELAKIGITVKSFFSENRHAFGSFWLVTNSYTRGISENEILDTVKKAALRFINDEENARSELIGRKKAFAEDLCWRSLGILSTARKLEMSEFMTDISNIRLACSLGIFDIDDDTLTDLFMHGQKSYIGRYSIINSIPEDESEAVVRARILREDFSPILKKALL